VAELERSGARTSWAAATKWVKQQSQRTGSSHRLHSSEMARRRRIGKLFNDLPNPESRGVGPQMPAREAEADRGGGSQENHSESVVEATAPASRQHGSIMVRALASGSNLDRDGLGRGDRLTSRFQEPAARREEPLRGRLSTERSLTRRAAASSYRGYNSRRGVWAAQR